MKIVILDGYTLNPGDLSWQALEAIGEVSVYDRTNTEDIVNRIGDAAYVYTNKTPITKETLDKCPNIKWIGVLATGYNVVDVEAAKAKSIPVCNVPTYGTSAVSQFVFALLLELCHHVAAHSDAVKNGDWSNSQDFCFWNYPLVELSGQTMGIIGLGKIGYQTAQIAQAFGMNVLAYDGYHNPNYESETLKYCTLEELYQGSDVISLHCPLFPETEGMINKKAIAFMKDSVLIINTSRGPLLNETDVKEALNTGKIAGLACDVVSTEPIQMDNPLLSAKNCMITPHIAWAPKASRARLLQTAVDNLKTFIDGKIVNAVNIK